ncbi:MAG: UDP-3-O-(3-hydroxymyristoyl)glucosamine N-acyltransferase [Pseudacidovorax sp.]|uniref:UDP-3-O-(3-hydroxymyristoyl)glucosamine N-acyltransferase n=1 Tax=Pseudacidovorax sp. TaxID=1934311 RepID=UPI001B54BEBF|nr:UDP-3-O-(3-hydroxymyristoyl)glucosamine N-acyltransferase [Pseudacidovorax sp.]MBP6896998.1 UDP-3-O-(3-hydroxymyristoyl)glucosamine N-acyltransferase [Pseudacidovorax sp.]
MSLLLGEIVAVLGGELLGDAAMVVERLEPLSAAGPAAISFLSHPRYRKELLASRAGCVIVAPSMRDEAMARGACLVVADPYLYFARLTQLWKARHSPAQPPGIHPSAVVDAGAHVDATAVIGPLCVVERGARIGAGTVLKSRVTVSEDCVIGDRCLLHPGVVIGADGFGLAPHEGAWVKIEQLGAVRIGNDVEIGANTCIDRGALEDTVLEDGVKLDNLIQIGHNVRVGRNTAMAGCVGVAGSAEIGAQCTIGGGAVVLGHLKLADGVHVSAATVVTRSILKPGQYTGVFPIDDNAAWERNAATLRHLHQLRERLRALEKQAASGLTP